MLSNLIQEVHKHAVDDIERLLSDLQLLRVNCFEALLDVAVKLEVLLVQPPLKWIDKSVGRRRSSDLLGRETDSKAILFESLFKSFARHSKQVYLN